MLGCATLFGPDRGCEIHRLLEAALGSPCPGETSSSADPSSCPLLPFRIREDGGDELDSRELGAAMDAPIVA